MNPVISTPPQANPRRSGWISDFWKFQLAVWVFYGFGTLPVHVIILRNQPWFTASVAETIGYCLSSAAVSIIATAGLREIYRLPRIRGARWETKLAVTAALSLLAACVKTLVIDPRLYYAWGEIDFSGLGPNRLMSARIAGFWIHVCLYASWSVLYFIVRARQAARMAEHRALVAENARMAAELRMLRSQIQPHFLYNALNSLTEETGDNPRADRIIQGMAEYLRYGLAHRSETAVELREEIEAIRNYLEIEKIRYGEALETTMDIDPASLELRTPGIFIQPLVENAIKHGLATTRSGPCRVSVATRRNGHSLTIQVANSGAWTPRRQDDEAPSGGLGLENLRGRLKLLYPDRFSFEIVPDQDRVVATLVLHDVRVTPSAAQPPRQAPAFL